MIRLWFIVLTFALELGVSSEQSAVYTDAAIPDEVAVRGNINLNSLLKNREFVSFKSGYALLEADVWLWDMVYMGGGVKTSFMSLPEAGERSWLGIGFNPLDASYMVRAGAKFGAIDIGFRHVCLHPAAPYFYDTLPSFAFDAGFEELYIRIEG